MVMIQDAVGRARTFSSVMTFKRSAPCRDEPGQKPPTLRRRVSIASTSATQNADDEDDDIEYSISSDHEDEPGMRPFAASPLLSRFEISCDTRQSPGRGTRQGACTQHSWLSVRMQGVLMQMEPLLAASPSPLRNCWTLSMSSPPASRKTWCAAMPTNLDNKRQ
jgi:hypothetical protein